MWEWLGYIALGMSLFSMTKTNIKSLRWLHLFASVFYLAYGLAIDAIPIMLGGAVFMLLHIYHLRRIYFSRKC